MGRDFLNKLSPSPRNPSHSRVLCRQSSWCYGYTVTNAVPAGPVDGFAPPSKPERAVIVAVPVLMAVTNPEAETVAIAGLLDVQVIVRPVIVVPPFLAVAVSWVVGVVARLSVGEPGVT